MCFLTPPNVFKAKVARRDIIAFKSLYVSQIGTRQTITSPVKRFSWKVGTLYTCPMDAQLSYKGKNIYVGFHCFKKKKGAADYSGNTVAPVMIPKGAFYYENEDQFVSNKMILLGSNIEVFEKVAKALKPIKKK